MSFLLSKRTLCFIIIAVIFNGCISENTVTDKTSILQKPYKKWTEEECRIVMKDYVSTNILDRAAPLTVVAIPCTPNFLLAYNCLKWKKHLCSFEEFYENTDRQARNCFGGSFDDRTGKFIDRNGDYVRDVAQFDSLLVTFDIKNQNDIDKLTTLISDPTLQPWVGSAFFFDLFPEITDMKEKISFRADHKILARPAYVLSGNGQFLIKEEQYAAMFCLNDELKQYIRSHREADLYFSMGYYSVSIPVRFAL
jgi:hypothetical protein